VRQLQHRRLPARAGDRRATEALLHALDRDHATLRKQGLDARYLAGGHSSWKAINGPVTLHG